MSAPRNHRQKASASQALRSVRRRRTSPVPFLLGVLAMVVVLAIVVVATRPRRHALPGETALPAAQDGDRELSRKVEVLRRAKLPPGEALQEARRLFAQARTAELQEEIKNLIDGFAKQYAVRMASRIEGEGPRIVGFAKIGAFEKASRELAKLREAYSDFLSQPYVPASIVTAAFGKISTAIEKARAERFARDKELLRAAVAAEDLQAANRVLEAIYRYATASMKKEADSIFDPFFEKLRTRQLAHKPSAPRREPSPPQVEVASQSEVSPEGEEVQEEPEEEGAGAQGLPEPAREQDTAEFGVLSIKKEGEFQFSFRGKKAELLFAKGCALYHDSALPTKRFIQALSPGMPVVFFGEIVNLNLAYDPTSGRRIRNVQLALVGKSWPQGVSWRDPRHKTSLWHYGSFVRMTPPPVLFDLRGQQYVLQGTPRYAVKRRIFSASELTKGRLRVFVKGKIRGSDTENPIVVAEELVVLPLGSVAAAPVYRAVLMH